MNWRTWFAWFPVTAIDGRRIWLRQIERAWDNEQNPWGYGGHSGTDGGWAYRLPLRHNAGNKGLADDTVHQLTLEN